MALGLILKIFLILTLGISQAVLAEEEDRERSSHRIDSQQSMIEEQVHTNKIGDLNDIPTLTGHEDRYTAERDWVLWALTQKNWMELISKKVEKVYEIRKHNQIIELLARFPKEGDVFTVEGEDSFHRRSKRSAEHEFINNDESEEKVNHKGSLEKSNSDERAEVDANKTNPTNQVGSVNQRLEQNEGFPEADQEGGLEADWDAMAPIQGQIFLDNHPDSLEENDSLPIGYENLADAREMKEPSEIVNENPSEIRNTSKISKPNRKTSLFSKKSHIYRGQESAKTQDNIKPTTSTEANTSPSSTMTTSTSQIPQEDQHNLEERRKLEPSTNQEDFYFLMEHSPNQEIYKKYNLLCPENKTYFCKNGMCFLIPEINSLHCEYEIFIYLSMHVIHVSLSLIS